MSNAVVDLRSDTLTTPTDAMRRAMAAAEVGDDVFGEDPTVRGLEERSAVLLAKEAALFVSSGTQGNLCALLTHCRPRQEVIAEERAHIVTWEVGGWASVAGLSMRAVHAPRGVLTAELIRDAIKPANVHLVDSRLVCVENTHNVAGGTYATPDDMRQIAAAARAHGLRIHVDGARIFNAAAAQNLAVADLVADADSVQFCLSKGLGAPVGSLLVGSREFISEGRRVRKMLGGGMRQAGVIAAAGLVALDEIAPKLPGDHANARLLAELLSDTPGLQIDLDLVQTNIVFWELGPALGTPVSFAARLEERGVRIIGFEGTRRCRAVTYHQISEESVRLAAQVIHDLAVELAP